MGAKITNDVNEAKAVELNNSDRYIGVRQKLLAMADWKDAALRSWLYELFVRGDDDDVAKLMTEGAFEDFKCHEQKLFNTSKL